MKRHPDYNSTSRCPRLTPFGRAAASTYIGLVHPLLCAPSAILNYLRCQSSVTLFLLSDGQPYSPALSKGGWKILFLQLLLSKDRFPVTTLGLVLPLLTHVWVSRITYKLYIKTPAQALAQVKSRLSHWLWQLVSFHWSLFAGCSTLF